LVLVPVQITDDDLTAIARHLHGAAGLGGTDAYTLKRWLLHHRDHSTKLRTALCHLIEWVSNRLVPWAAV
jgi:hypothetical protein